MTNTSSEALDEQSREDLDLLERIEALRSGEPLWKVRPAVARAVGIPPGTAESIRKRRIKGVRGWVKGRIEAALVRALRAEKARLGRELELVLARDRRADEDEVAAARVALEQTRRLIEEARRAGRRGDGHLR